MFGGYQRGFGRNRIADKPGGSKEQKSIKSLPLPLSLLFLFSTF